MDGCRMEGCMCSLEGSRIKGYRVEGCRMKDYRLEGWKDVGRKAIGWKGARGC